jgi:hypothetical protein
VNLSYHESSVRYAMLLQKGIRPQVNVTGDSRWMCATHWAIGKICFVDEHVNIVNVAEVLLGSARAQ